MTGPYKGRRTMFFETTSSSVRKSKTLSDDILEPSKVGSVLAIDTTKRI